MNGRIYDPLIGRFLSADVIVDGPMSLQGYNRYSYVKNNPLTYWDPNGYQKGRKYTEKQLASMRARRDAFNNSGVGMIYNGVGQVAINFVPWVGDAVGTGQDVNDVVNGSTTDKTIGSASLALNAWTLGASPGLSGIKNGGKSIFKGVMKLFGKGADDVVDGVRAVERTGETTSDLVHAASPPDAPIPSRVEGEAPRTGSDGGEVATNKPVQPDDNGPYGELKAQKRAYGETEPMDMDHRPSYAAQKKNLENQLGRELTPEEAKALKDSTHAVATPRKDHQQKSRTYGGRNNQEQIDTDAADLEKARRLDDEGMR